MANLSPVGRVLDPEGFTVDALDQFPDDGYRYELLDGMVLMTPAPGFAHQTAVVRLLVLLHEAKSTDYHVLAAPFAMRMGPHTEVQPDLVVAPRAAFGEQRLERAPDLVVEVLSPSTRRIDLGAKLEAYAEFGIPCYWVVDPREPAWVSEYRLDGVANRYRLIQRTDKVFTTDLPFHVSFHAGDLTG
jgi:Uma2 family endonuclease